MKTFSRMFATLITVALLLGVLSLWEVYWRAPSADATAVTITVASGDTLKDVAELLKQEQIIGSKFLFRSYAGWQNLDKGVMAGTYELRPGMSVRDALAALVQTPQSELSITLLEGWSLREVEEYLVSQDLAQAGELTELTGRPAQSGPGSETEFVKSLRTEYDFLASKPETVSLEGYLFPDTYRLFSDAAVEDMVRKTLDNFDQKIDDELRLEITRQGKTVHEIMTMASIIEREVRGMEDRRLVSDLFWRRYNIGMPLQADSTVNYVTGKDTPAISLADRDLDSPYNTYQYPGLPPGPICNPSLDAIYAAVYPTANEAWYFLTDPEGNVHYAATNEEHAANKAAYLR